MLVSVKQKDRIRKLFTSSRFIYVLGFILVLLVTVAMVIDERYKVFLVYKFGTLDFWNSINPYAEWQHPLDRYLYGPVFSVFFLFFAFLPSWLGAVFWNIFNYSLFFCAVFTLPANLFNTKRKRFVFWFLFPIALTDLFYFQSNLFVASFFLLAYSLCEQNRFLYGIVVILFSGFSKIYGFIQLGTLLFYRRFWRNVLAVVVLSVLLFLIPLLKVSFSELLAYYQSWFVAIDQRHNPLDFEVIYRLFYILGYKNAVNQIPIIQVVSLAIISLLILANHKKHNNAAFRTQVLGIVLGWVILFSTTAEKHTYVIAMAGLVLWHLSDQKTTFDKVLLWINFLLIILIPIDAIFPKELMRFLYYRLGLNLLLFSITWLRMLSYTFIGDALSVKFTKR
ncbi:MAG: glycosyltransferase 87 family protein [Draconibacterium sp.]